MRVWRPVSCQERRLDVPVLLVQKVDTSNIQNETGANGVSQAEGLTGCIAMSAGD